MANLEKGTHLGASPEDFGYGRVDLDRTSRIDLASDLVANPNNKDIERPEFEVRLNDGRSQKHVVFARWTSERPRSKDQKLDISPWEPFNLEPNPHQRFVNLYGGPFSALMEFSRANADRLLEVAGIQGDVILTDVPMDRNRGIAGVNADGSVSKKRNLFFGEKLEEDQSRTLVRPTSDGWKIEIPGQEIMEQLSRQESKTPLDKRFTARFNQVVRDSLREIIFKEKLTAEKDKYIRFKIINSSAVYLCSFGMLKLSDLMAPSDSVGAKIGEAPNYIFIPSGIALGLMMQGLLHVSTKRRIYHPEENRSLTEPYEYFMPYVEIDRYTRGIAFMKNKGRNLVRLKPTGID